MSFTPYVIFTSEIGEQLFEISFPTENQLFGEILQFLPKESDQKQTANSDALVAKCKEIIEAYGDQEKSEELGQFEELLEFLEESSQCQMLLRGEPRSLDQVVACAIDGGLDDEWTKAFIQKQHDVYLPELKQRLMDPRNSNSSFAIIRLLLLCYPRDRVEPIVSAFIAETENQDQKEQAEFLLCVFS